jgi:hypothetical protein
MKAERNSKRIFEETMPLHRLFTMNMKLLCGEGKAASEITLGPTPDYGPFKTLKAKSGDITVVKFSNATDHRFVHSGIDPRAEAIEWVNHQKFSNETAVVFGMGLGYHITEILSRQLGPESLYVIEVDQHLFQIAMGLFDFTPILSNPSIHLFLGENPLSFRRFITKSVCRPFSLHFFLPSIQLHQEIYHNLTILLDERRYELKRRNEPHNAHDKSTGGFHEIQTLLEEMCR